MRKTIVILLTLGVFLTSLFSCASDKKEVVIASKNFTENIILSELMAQVIENHTDIEVVRRQNMGTTFIVFSALKSNEISMYPDYTGTLYQANLKQTELLSKEKTYNFVKKEMAKQGVFVLDEFGFNNTYAIGLLAENAKARNLVTISDLKNHPDLVLGFDPEFINRSDGALAMIDRYGLQFDTEIVQMEIGLKLIALANGDVDVTDAFSTDSKLLRYDVTILEDDQSFFPPYYAVPVINKETDEQYPEVREALSKLSGLLNESEIIQLNYAVEDDKKNVGDVVAQFLREKNVIE